MADGLLGGQELVGRWDDDARLFRVTGWTVGPAGSARLELAGGVYLEIDVADPRRAVDVLVEAPLVGSPSALPDETARSLFGLIGAEAVKRLLALGSVPASGSGSGSPGEVRPVRLTLSGRYARIVAPELLVGRVALLRQEALEADGVVAQAALLLEAGVLGSSLEVALVPSPVENLRDGGGLLLDAGGEALEIEDEFGASLLAETVRRAARGLDDVDEVLSRRLRRLAERIRASSGYAVAMVDHAATAPAAAAMRRRREPVEPFRRVGPSEVSVQLSLSEGGQWARAFRSSDRLPLAMAPIDDDGRATLIVPPRVGDDEVIYDVTDQPEAPLSSEDLVTLRRAAAVGQGACRAERRGQDRQARSEWEECAAGWESLGDGGRAARARAYSRGEDVGTGPRGGRGGSRVPAEFVADRLS